MILILLSVNGRIILKNMEIKLTVLLSVYNDELTLDHCFKSLKNQTFQNFNIFCINDASTDSSLVIMKKWKKYFGQRMNIVSNNLNLGLTKSLNKGLSAIETAFIARLDADDWWSELKLEKQMKFIENNQTYNIIGCNYVNINHFDKTKKFITLKETNREIKDNLIMRNQFAHSCVIFSTDLIKKIGNYNETIKYAQDYELWLRAMPIAKFYNLQDFLCERKTGIGISAEKQYEQMKQVIKFKIQYIHKYGLYFGYLSIIELFLMMILSNFKNSNKI